MCCHNYRATRCEGHPSTLRLLGKDDDQGGGLVEKMKTRSAQTRNAHKEDSVRARIESKNVSKRKELAFCHRMAAEHLKTRSGAG